MSIKDFSEKIKEFVHIKAEGLGSLSDDLFLGLIITLVAIGAFGLGRISKIEGSRAPIRIENEPVQMADDARSISTTAEQGTQAKNTIIASKSGKKYYYSWCSGAQKISAANRVYFSSPEQAKSAGYMPSSTCRGL